MPGNTELKYDEIQIHHIIAVGRNQLQYNFVFYTIFGYQIISRFCRIENHMEFLITITNSVEMR